MKINFSQLLSDLLTALKDKKLVATLTSVIVTIAASFALHLSPATVAGIIGLVATVGGLLEAVTTRKAAEAKAAAAAARRASRKK